MKMGPTTVALFVGCHVGRWAVVRGGVRHAAGQKKVAAKKMGPTTVAHSGGRHVGGRHVGRWAVVRGGVHHAAMPCERLINGGPTLPQVAVAAPPGPVIFVH